jgi:hypothetical protein
MSREQNTGQLRFGNYCALHSGTSIPAFSTRNHLPGHGPANKDGYELRKTQKSAYVALPHPGARPSITESTRILVAFPEIYPVEDSEVEAVRAGPEREAEIKGCGLRSSQLPIARTGRHPGACAF